MPEEIDVLRALAHPVRWGILERLAAEPGICACDFTEFFDVSQPTISAHLKALRGAGLVTTQRQGTAISYSLARDRLAGLADHLADMVASAPAPVAAAPQPPARRSRAADPVPAAARVPGRLADMVAPALAAAARMPGRSAGGTAAVAQPAVAQPAVPQPAVPQPSRRLADMAAMAQAAVPWAPARRSRAAAPARQAPRHGRTDGPAPAASAGQ